VQVTETSDVSSASAADASSQTHVVDLGLPALTPYVSVLRSTAAALAARLDFTLDEIEDLRIAVDEACAMLIRLAAPAAPLRCRFALTDEELGVEVAVPTIPEAVLPAPTSYTWKVLTALAGSPSASVAEETATIALTARRSSS
jgi:serine/threonine-protein kinase RsbW